MEKPSHPQKTIIIDVNQVFLLAREQQKKMRCVILNLNHKQNGTPGTASLK